MPHNIRTPLLDLVSDLRGGLGKFAAVEGRFGLNFWGGSDFSLFGRSWLLAVGCWLATAAVLVAQRTLHLAGVLDNAKTNRV